MDLYVIKESTKEESDLIWQGLIDYNSSKLSLKGHKRYYMKKILQAEE